MQRAERAWQAPLVPEVTDSEAKIVLLLKCCIELDAHASKDEAHGVLFGWGNDQRLAKGQAGYTHRIRRHSASPR